jgi:threonine/homoserine/homoserine lactone efflux protein
MKVNSRPTIAVTPMTYELFTGLALFASVASITPGPNNLMLMASGANYGFRRTIPHMAGVSAGFVLMVFLVGIGLAQLFIAYPVSHTILKAFSVAYLLYLAFKIATATLSETSASGSGRPFTFIQAALFQWVNPKAWTMALTAVTVYSPTQTLASVALVAGIFGIINLPAIGFWIMLGKRVQRYLRSDKHLLIFNLTMAALLVASLIPVFTSSL